MSLLKNLSTIVTAPVKVIDKTVLEPLAYAAGEAAKGFTDDEEE